MTDDLLAACERLKSNDGDYWWSVDRLPHAAKDVRAVSSALPALIARVRELEANDTMLRGIVAEGMDRYELAHAEIARLSNALDDAQKFKAYVHKRLDDAGIDTHPDGPHSKEGCRVGDRLDIALSKLARVREQDAKLAAVRAECEKMKGRVYFEGSLADRILSIIDAG